MTLIVAKVGQMVSTMSKWLFATPAAAMLIPLRFQALARAPRRHQQVARCGRATGATEVTGPRRGHDRRRRQRGAGAQAGRHRRGDGTQRHRGRQGRQRHGAHRRRLRHHRGGRGGGARRLRQPHQVHRVDGCPPTWARPWSSWSPSSWVSPPALPVQLLWVNMATSVLAGNDARSKQKSRGSGASAARPPPATTTFRFMRTGLVSLLTLAGAFGLFLWENSRMPLWREARLRWPTLSCLRSCVTSSTAARLLRSSWSLGAFSNLWLLGGLAATGSPRRWRLPTCCS